MSRRLVIGSTFVAIAVTAGVLFTRRISQPPTLETHSLRVGAFTRSYLVVQPENRSGPRPVLIAFHGTFDDPQSFLESSRLVDLANTEGTLVIGPKAMRGMWFVDEPNHDGESRDVRFFDALVDDLEDRYAVDSNRIYVVGFSNGGEFAHRLAVARSDVVAAAVAYGGCLTSSEPVPEHCVPLSLVVGSDDSPSRVRAIRNWRDRLRRSNFDAAFRVVAGTGHSWAPEENARIWRFLSQHSRGHD